MGGNKLARHLTLIFNMFCSHNYIPTELTKTTIMPMLKNKAVSPNDVNNYRAIALSNGLSKVLENVILSCFKMCDQSNDLYQFGFEKTFYYLVNFCIQVS